MKQLYVEINDSTRAMSFAELGNLMAPADLSNLIDRLSEDYKVPVNLQDGQSAIIRQDSLIPTLTGQPMTFEVTLSTSIPVSARIFVMATDEAEAEKVVQRLIAQDKIKRQDIPNIKQQMEAELQHWVEQTEPEDWQVEDVTPKLSS